MQVTKEFTQLENDFNETTIVRSFCDMLEQSKQLFIALGDLPRHGQKQWQPHFAKTFESYTKLWKYQQENRTVLDRCYNLKRWQIGEIASKIAQLYYHYYLRTSETNYLKEAYQFYSAIRARNYYRAVDDEKNPVWITKKYRYYARYIVICLLLNCRQDAINLIKELSKQVKVHKVDFEKSGGTDWDMVVQEIKNFPDVDPIEVLISTTYQRSHITMRMLPTTLPICDSGFKTVLSLGDGILVGNSPLQFKFSELTIDMLRMIHVLERAAGSSRTPSKPRPVHEKSESASKKENPHKYLLYRPNVYDLFTCLSTAIKELPPSEVLLFYISADGRFQKNMRKPEVEGFGYDGEGVITNDGSTGDKNSNELARKSTSRNDMHCLHPADLYPFLRKPMMIIIDSDNASSFANFPDLFGQPVVILMSPNEVPNSIKIKSHDGRLMTSFLYSPLMAFMLVCGVNRISDQVYAACSDIVNKSMAELQKIFLRSKTVDYNFLLFCGDDFLRLILLRFAFYFYTVRLHKAFKDPNNYPKCFPSLPDEFFNSVSVTRTIIDLSDILGVQGLFDD